MSKGRIVVVLLVVIVGIAGVVVGYFASRFSQDPSTKAASFAEIPTLKTDETSSDETSSDETDFMTKFENKDPSADLDGSGQVNTLDLAKYRQLKNEK